MAWKSCGKFKREEQRQDNKKNVLHAEKKGEDLKEKENPPPESGRGFDGGGAEIRTAITQSPRYYSNRYLIY
ncbi:hypothetical protein [uncultured Desulfuromonas sp.]|uniref:hypothetical protein n=1 Tax=uncultured Desulfuromonas sp. TaxID=181013 RepID=UPI002AAA7E9D|nr:hypothetical protein [uncultured Desulfuromonas sp.]